jgi:signal transduction histidine kinase
VRISDLIEDALRMAGTLDGHQVNVIREVADDPLLSLDKHRVLLILLNLISNATQAMNTNSVRARRLTLRSEVTPDHMLRMSVTDSGEGIPVENLTRIFVHGFTTHPDGHGFGLHSSALAAQEIGGTLTVDNIPGGGAVFTLQVPLQPETVTA